jgi:hypothetical protein
LPEDGEGIEHRVIEFPVAFAIADQAGDADFERGRQARHGLQPRGAGTAAQDLLDRGFVQFRHSRQAALRQPALGHHHAQIFAQGSVNPLGGHGFPSPVPNAGPARVQAVARTLDAPVPGPRGRPSARTCSACNDIAMVAWRHSFCRKNSARPVSRAPFPPRAVAALIGPSVQGNPERSGLNGGNSGLPLQAPPSHSIASVKPIE